MKQFAGGDGQNPYATLVLSGATLYGTTKNGGSGGDGTVFSLGTNGASFATLMNFGGANGSGPGALVLGGTNLYGATSGEAFVHGTIFRIGTTGAGFTTVRNFDVTDELGNANLLLSGSTLYGTGEGGGLNFEGSVFMMNTDGSGYTLLRSFGGADGEFPDAGMALNGATLYGTTENGGAGGDGTVFQINTDGSGFATLKSFAGADGAEPSAAGAGLVLSSNLLYGAAADGGLYGQGVVFSVSPMATIAPPTLVFGPVITNGAFVVRYRGTPGVTYTIWSRRMVTGELAAGERNRAGNGPGFGSGVFQFSDFSPNATNLFFRVVYPAE